MITRDGSSNHHEFRFVQKGIIQTGESYAETAATPLVLVALRISGTRLA